MNISHLSKNLTRISEREKVDNNEKLPVISNDELGDMTIAFNKILDIENNYIEDIKKTTEHMMDQEKFISLGHLIGGIAHNFRTPIMSISGALIKLKRLIEEYDQAIGDKEVNNEDHKEIAKEMMEWISKIEPYCGYMSGMLSAVKNQIAGENINDDLSFRIGDLVDSATFLMEHELKISGCTLKTKINMDLETIVKGDISVIIQIIGNLIQNSIYAYNKKGGDIIFEINDKKSVLELLIRDFGAGISKEIENKIFREMITTKGNKGSGLGLFIAKNSLKAKMNGKIYFESELKKGTTFHIEIPMK